MRDFQEGHSIHSEVIEAEFHLRRREPHPALIALALGLLMVLVSGKVANASPAPVAEMDGCSAKIESVQFAGTFKLEAHKDKTMRFVIGFPEGHTSDHAIAQIWSGNHCQATCSSLTFDKGDLSVPLSLDLQCRGGELGPLSAHVAVLWDHGPKPSTVLRFGSWLEGYEQARMKIEVDRFNATDVAERTEETANARSRKRRMIAYRVPGLSVAQGR